jgi:DNA-directed RNA polymerase specialized sigma24 family protein
MPPPTAPRLTLAQAYQEHRASLVRLALLLTGSREHAEDVVQSVFAAVHERWDSIDQPLPYLRRAVAYASIDVARRARREIRLLAAEPITHIPDVDETWRVLASLSVRQRTVVVLHYYEDLALVDIAALLAMPASTVRSDLRRALIRLRKELS